MKLQTKIKAREIKYKFVDAIAYILIGVLFCVLKSSVINWLLTIVGAILIALGIYNITKKETTSGAIEIGAGIIVILGGWLFVEIILIILGVLLLIKGILDLVSAISTKLDTLSIVYACINILIGVMLIISKWALLDWFFIILGIIFIINGALVFFRKEVETEQKE